MGGSGISLEGDDLYDLTIVGAGPTGLFAAFYAGLRDMKTKIIDTLPLAGGQLITLYPEKFIYDSPGYRRILAKDLVKNLLDQANQFGPTLCLGETVRNIAHVSGGTIRVDTDGGSHFSRAVLIAVGVGSFSPNKLDRPGIGGFEGRGVYYHVGDRPALRGKRVVIVGGGDTAVDWALNLKDWVSHLTVVHRRGVFRAVESSVVELFHSDVVMKIPFEINEVRGGRRLEKVVIFNNQTGDEQVLDADALLVMIGYKTDLGPARNWGLEFSGREIAVNGRMETNIPGVFAAGDAVSQEGSVKLKLLATGFAQAAVAVNVAKHYVNPESRIKPFHSSGLTL